MTDPLKLAEEMTSGNPWTGPDKPSLMRFSENEIALFAAALRLAEKVPEWTSDDCASYRPICRGSSGEYDFADERHPIRHEDGCLWVAFRKARGA